MNEFLKFCEWRTAGGYERAIGQVGDSRQDPGSCSQTATMRS